ncbi:MAG: cobalt/nickel transport system permease protein [Chloroflexi bacterium]|nr:MAG: cobalt/nickel transport system permease protein [Chloroflexota bacterium]
MRARASRSAAAIGNNHSGGSVFWRGEVTGKMAGNLLLRSLERSDRVYAAMCSRGYNGEPLQINKKSIKKPEVLFLAGAIVTLTLILLLGFFTQA